MGVIKDLTGQRFGRLAVVKATEWRKDRCVMWLCLCDCGDTTLVRSNSLLAGLTKSCGCYMRERSADKEGNKNPMWRGDNVSLGALHAWIRRLKPKPKVCEICHVRKPQDLANISQEYKRDIDDYQWICRRCHMKSDFRMESRRGNGQFQRVDHCQC